METGQTHSILLSHSGHRDKDTQKVTMDIDYNDTHRTLREELRTRFKEELARVLDANPNISNVELLTAVRRQVSREADIRNFEIVIPISEVQSVNFFDKEIYDRYFAPETPTSSSDSGN